MKQFFQKVNKMLPVIVSVIGLPLAFYGVWFQTEGFKWIPVLHCAACLAAALTAAFFLMQYLQEQIESGKAGAMASRKGLHSVISGSLVSFFFSMLVLYRCTSLLAFYIGLLAMLFSWACIVFQYVFSKTRHKRKDGEGKK